MEHFVHLTRRDSRVRAPFGEGHMTTRIISTPSDLFQAGMRSNIAPLENPYCSDNSGLDGSTPDLAESPATRTRAARGVLLSVLVGAAFYAVGLSLVGLIRLS